MQDLLREIAILCTAPPPALDWDQETFAPPKAVDFRSKQLAYLAAEKSTELKTSRRLPGRAGGRLSRRSQSARAKTPVRSLPPSSRGELVERASETSTRSAKAAWSEAREKDDFSLFAPHLSRSSSISPGSRPITGATRTNPTTRSSPSTSGPPKTREVAGPLRFHLRRPGSNRRRRRRKISRHSRQPPPRPGSDSRANDAQPSRSPNPSASTSRPVGSTPPSIPFCTTLGPADIRLTTRYDKNDFASSLFGVMHETGHGLYEQGLPGEDFPLSRQGQAVSLGIHESQSRLWENHVGRSRPFWERWLPRAQELFPHLRHHRPRPIPGRPSIAPLTPPSGWRPTKPPTTCTSSFASSWSAPSSPGELEVSDVPGAWNETFESLFGFRPWQRYREGCLQDIHWSMGGLGYFATYSLGNLNAAQLHDCAAQDSEVIGGTRQGNFIPLLEWMQKKIHAKGSTLFPQDLMESATGSPTKPDAYLAHLRERFC